VHVLGREAEIDGQNVYASMNQLIADQTRYLILEVELPAGRAGEVRRLADVEVTHFDLGGGGEARRSGQVSIRYSDSPRAVEGSTDTEVMASVVRQLGAERAEMAMALRDAGKLEEAREAFSRNTVFLRQQAEQYDDDSLRRDAASNADFSEGLSDEEWERTRKLQQQYQVKTQQQRSYLVDGKDDRTDDGKKKD
jgi:Ca-activated chloride channel family protein